MYNLHSGSTAPCVPFQGPQSEKLMTRTAADACVSLSPAILSPQVSSSEAMRILSSQESASDSELLCVADTMLSLGTEVIAPNRAPRPISTLLPLHKHALPVRGDAQSQVNSTKSCQSVSGQQGRTAVRQGRTAVT